MKLNRVVHHSVKRLSVMWLAASIVVLQSVSQAATVESVSRSVEVEDDTGAKVFKRHIICSNSQKRIITKANNSTEWCFVESEFNEQKNCSKDKLQAAKKACRASTTKALDLTAKKENRQRLILELESIEAERKLIKDKLDLLEQRKMQLTSENRL